jgi:hypothetical protein
MGSFPYFNREMFFFFFIAGNPITRNHHHPAALPGEMKGAHHFKKGKVFLRGHL